MTWTPNIWVPDIYINPTVVNKHKHIPVIRRGMSEQPLAANKTSLNSLGQLNLCARVQAAHDRAQGVSINVLPEHF